MESVGALRRWRLITGLLRVRPAGRMEFPTSGAPPTRAAGDAPARGEQSNTARYNQTESAASSRPGRRSLTGGLIGRIEVPRLGVSVIVIEGINGKTLRRAVGHIPGTALPGQPGNVGISGHRGAGFRPLRKHSAE